MFLGRALWPGGLGAGTENLFWPATAVHAAGLLRLGLPWWPVAFAGTVFGQLSMGRPLDSSLLNAAGNAIEAVAFVWALRRFAGGSGQTPLDTLRGVSVYLVAALVAPLGSALIGAGTLVAKGWIPASDYWPAVGVWNFANAASLVILTPLLLHVRREVAWRGEASRPEFVLWLVVGVSCTWFAIEAVFKAGGAVNFAFLAYPFVIYSAVRFGLAATSLALGLLMAAIYGALIRDHPVLTPEGVFRTLWFVQAYCFTLGGTGLLLAALTRERHLAALHAREEKNRAMAASLGEARARLAALRYQLNPHFLFNSLNSLRATLPHSSTVSREMVTDLAEYLRSTLESDGSELIPLEREIDSVRRYLAIEQTRFGEALRVEIVVEPGVARAPVPSFLLQPLVENALRHGFGATKGDFLVSVRAGASSEKLCIEIINTGSWKPPSGRAGLGLDNVRERLALVYGDRASLETGERDGSVRVSILLPLVSP